MAIYTLPELSYDYSALEPHIDARIMELHHSKHHKAYVDGANKAVEGLAEAREKGDLANVNKLEKDLAFNLAGHVNHCVFWTNMTPQGQEMPEGEIASAIDNDFGSFDGFKKHFEAAATGLQGSGWAMLVWDSLASKMLILQVSDHQTNLPVGVTPLLMLDMWEHAFYLQYENVKADYVKAWWNVVNWQDVQERLTRATTATRGLIVPA